MEKSRIFKIRAVMSPSSVHNAIGSFPYNKYLGGLLYVLFVMTFLLFLYVTLVLTLIKTEPLTRRPIPSLQHVAVNRWYPESGMNIPMNLGSDKDISTAGDFILSRNSYKSDAACQNFTKRLFKPGHFNRTALVSFPGSGNTWLRNLIELASGIYTGSMYFDLDLISKGFLGEKELWTSGTTIVQKTHEKYRRKSRFTKSILLIRDPYQSIVSFVQFLEAGHTGASSGHTFRKEGWAEYVLGQTFQWISLLKSWIEAPIPILVVHYENVRRNASNELQRICDYLAVKCYNLNTICFKNHKEGDFHRKNKSPNVPSFPKWVRAKVDDGIDYLSKLLQEKRNLTLPLSYYSRNNLHNQTS